MATVTNDSHERVDVPLFGLIFGPGETQEVKDDVAVTLGRPFTVTGLASVQPASAAPDGGTPAAPVDPSATVEQPAEIIETPAAPAAPEGDS